MSSIKCVVISPQVHPAQALFGSNFFPLTEKALYILLPVSLKTSSWAEAIRAKLICVVRACTRVIYSRAGFVQELLAWLTSEPTCTNAFCPNWSRLPQEGSLWRNFATPQVTMAQFGKMFVPHRKLQNFCRFQ